MPIGVLDRLLGGFYASGTQFTVEQLLDVIQIREERNQVVPCFRHGFGDLVVRFYALFVAFLRLFANVLVGYGFDLLLPGFEKGLTSFAHTGGTLSGHFGLLFHLDQFPCELLKLRPQLNAVYLQPVEFFKC